MLSKVGKAKLQAVQDGSLHKRRVEKLRRGNSPVKRLQMTNSMDHTLQRSADSRTGNSRSTDRQFLISHADLQHCLYESNEIRPVAMEDLRQPVATQSTQADIYWCEVCGRERAKPCALHGPHHSRKTRRTVEPKQGRLSAAVESFPDEVELCESSIPGAGYGVRSKRNIPMGTWIGPYEGQQIRAQQVTPEMDTSYMWEISHEGRLAYFLDGRDENCSSWMRFIRCARQKREQNMFAFQYMGNIYYRAFKDIPEGTELLVWYDESYPQHMGIPLDVQETAAVGSADPNQHGEMVVVVPRAFHSAPRPPWQPLPGHQGPLGVPRVTRPPGAFMNVRPNQLALRSMPMLYGQEAPEVRSAGRNILEAETPRGEFAASTSTVAQASNFPDSVERPGRSDSESSTKTEEMPSPNDGDKSEDSEFGIFRCGQCGKSFNQRSVLQIHVCPKMPYRPYHCGHCDESFNHPNDLRNHAAVHSSEKPFKCGYCQRSFSGATTLNNHIRTHTGEKPFICDRCGKSFTQASQLAKHQKIPGDCID